MHHAAQAPVYEQIAAAAVHGYHGFVFREHQHILAERAVELIVSIVIAHPNLVAVAVLHFAVWRFYLHGCGLAYPFLAHYLLTVPAAHVHAKLPKLRRVLCRERKAPAAFFYAHGALFPFVIAYAKRLEQPRRKEVHKAHARALYHRRRKHI